MIDKGDHKFSFFKFERLLTEIGGIDDINLKTLLILIIKQYKKLTSFVVVPLFKKLFKARHNGDSDQSTFTLYLDESLSDTVKENQKLTTLLAELKIEISPTTSKTILPKLKPTTDFSKLKTPKR